MRCQKVPENRLEDGWLPVPDLPGLQIASETRLLRWQESLLVQNQLARMSLSKNIDLRPE